MGNFFILGRVEEEMKIYFAGEPFSHDEKHFLKAGGDKRLFSFYEKGYFVRALKFYWKEGINVKSVSSVPIDRRRD